MINSSIDTADVSQAMLDVLGYPVPQNCAGLAQRIRYACDPQQLWHLRGDLMLALALRRGEVWAAEELARITRLFQTGLPHGLASCVGRAQGRAEGSV